MTTENQNSWASRLNKLRMRKKSPEKNNNLQAVMYTRVGCHLCDEAKKLLQSYGFKVTPVDLDTEVESKTREAFTDWVPVIEIAGKIRFRGRVDERLLKRIVQGEKK